MQDKMNPREAAYLALLTSFRGERFISESLEEWKQSSSPSGKDINFAQQLALGTMQMSLALDYLAEQLAKRKLSLKQKERLLLRLSLYQYYFLERVPIYAIVDEMMEVAKKYCHISFAKFLNAILRKLPETVLSLPEGDTVDNLSIKYSYPKYFVEQLLNCYGIAKTKEILRIGNTPAPVMARARNASDKNNLPVVCDTPVSFVLVHPETFSSIANSNNFYIQNVTPATLMKELSEGKNPDTLLDLCASPGGKLLMAHDLFPQAKLYGNDITAEKIKILESNCKKYDITATLTCQKGENATFPDLFDVIILDVPCSNSGVLNKRAEARWRLDEGQLKEIEEIQWNLIKHAVDLLRPSGELWYLTCSILPQENQEIVKKACRMLNLKVRKEVLILPNEKGWDGGYGCSLVNN